MTISSNQYTVSTTPVSLGNPDHDGVSIVLNATQNIYLDGDSVGVSSGYLHTKTDPPLQLFLSPGEILYAIRAGTQDAVVTVLRTQNQ